jgi:hypothetical protein
MEDLTIMTNLPFLLRIGAISSAVALVMLIVIGIMILPTGLDFPGEEIITGKLDPSSPGSDQYVTTFQLTQAFDNVFIIGWFVSWVSVAALVRARSRLLGNVTLFLGLIGGPFLDFVENEIIWAVLQALQLGISPSPDWFLAWKIAHRLSFWLPYTGGVMVAFGIWSGKTLDRAISIAIVFFTALGAVGMHIPPLHLLGSGWFMIWFILSTVLLWRRATEQVVEETNPPEE